MKKRLKSIQSKELYIAIVLTLVDIFLQKYFRSIGYGIYNFGVSLGAFGQIGGVISLVVFAIFMIWFLYEYSKYKRIPLGIKMIVFGGLGNLFSRLSAGSVWDYIYMPFLSFWFNLSDVLISMGVVSYILGCNEDRDSIRG